MKKVLFTLILILLVQNSFRAQTSTGTQEDNATIYIYRVINFYGSGVKMTILANGNPVVKLKNGGFYKFETKPGDYFFNIYFGSTSGIKFYAEAGKNYYIKCSYNQGFWSAYPILELVDPASGKAYIEGNTLKEQPIEILTLKKYNSQIGLQFSGGIGFEEFALFIDENGDDVNLSPGGGFGIGADYSYILRNNFDISLSCFFQGSTLSRYLENASASFNRMSFMVTPSLVIPGKRRDISRFKIGAGAGLYSFGTMKIDASEIGDTKYNLKYKSAPGFHATAIFESNYSARGSFNLGIRYINVHYKYKEEGSSHYVMGSDFQNPDGSSFDFFMTYSFHF